MNSNNSEQNIGQSIDPIIKPTIKPPTKTTIKPTIKPPTKTTIKTTNITSTESILLSHIIVVSIIIMYIILPLFNSFNINDQSLELFNKHYNTNFYKTIIITFFINYVYLKIADYIPGNTEKIYKRIVVVLVLSVLLNYYISFTTYNSDTIIFMKEWLKNIGWFGILWDLVNTLSVGFLADKINKYNLDKNSLAGVLFFLFFTFGLIHV
jgi:hypothetical protein